jgi:hypothetical protein
MSSPSSIRPPLLPPSPSPPSPDPPPSGPNGLSHTTIGIIVALQIVFVAFLLTGVMFGPRISAWLSAPSATLPRTRETRRTKKYRPQLWEVRLSDDRECESRRSSGAIHDWQASHPYTLHVNTKTITNRNGRVQNFLCSCLLHASLLILIRHAQPIAAWTDDPPTSPTFKASSALATTVPGIGHHVAMAQTWCYSGYPFISGSLIQSSAPRPPARTPVPNPPMLNVAFLIAMPSPRPDANAHPTRETTSHHHAVGPPLSYGDGQLSMGVTSLPCKERVMGATLRECEWAT